MNGDMIIIEGINGYLEVYWNNQKVDILTEIYLIEYIL